MLYHAVVSFSSWFVSCLLVFMILGCCDVDGANSAPLCLVGHSADK